MNDAYSNVDNAARALDSAHKALHVARNLLWAAEEIELRNSVEELCGRLMGVELETLRRRVALEDLEREAQGLKP